MGLGKPHSGPSQANQNLEWKMCVERWTKNTQAWGKSLMTVVTHHYYVNFMTFSPSLPFVY